MLSRRILRSRPWILLRSLHPPPPPTTTTTTKISTLPSSSSSSSPPLYFPAKITNLNYSYGGTNNRFFSTQSLVDPPVGGIVEIPLAQTGEGIAECELLKWFVKEGDQVEEFQPLCEVQSDKATIEITSRYKGKISVVLAECGDIVKVGETLLKMVVEESQNSALPSDCLTDALSSSSDTVDAINSNFSLDKHNTGAVLSTPAVRNLAKHYGININDIHGTGKDGRVLKEDVLKFAVDKEVSTSSSASSIDQLLMNEENILHRLTEEELQFEDKKLTLRGFQRAMVKTMTMAANVPHFHYLEEINCEALVNLKAAFQNENSDPDIKHTYLPFLVKSLSVALSKYPLMNSSFSEESHEVILKGEYTNLPRE